MKPQTRNVMISLSGGALLTALMLFQNCSRIGFDQNADSLRSLSDGLVTNAQTQLNTPVDVALRHAGNYNGVTLAVRTDDGNGTYQVVDADGAKVTFTPAYGFRGDARATFTVRDRYGTTETLELITSVANGLSALQPALAVRGMGCVQCHAQVASNVLTDFGYGDPYYFTGGTAANGIGWNNGSLYGDHGTSFPTINLMNNTVIVPMAPLPSAVAAAAAGGSTLADYLRQHLGSAPTGTVTEMTSVYIGAPTAAAIESALRLGPSERVKFYGNDGSSPTVTGLLDKSTYVRNDPAQPLTCDGDVAIRGPLLLDNLQLDTVNGCRLYVIGSVFVYGPITYVNANPNRNLQITSSRTVAMGIGQIYQNGTVCEPGDRYDKSAPGYDANYDADVLFTRYEHFWTVPSQVTRESNDGKALGAAVLADRDLIQAGEGTLYDSSCRPETRQVGFERLLVNAPSVHSRYEGNFDGTVIAEYAIMSLQMFKFQFDPVFKNPQVPVLPFLARSQYLDATP